LIFTNLTRDRHLDSAFLGDLFGHTSDTPTHRARDLRASVDETDARKRAVPSKLKNRLLPFGFSLMAKWTISDGRGHVGTAKPITLVYV